MAFTEWRSKSMWYPQKVMCFLFLFFLKESKYEQGKCLLKVSALSGVLSKVFIMSCCCVFFTDEVCSLLSSDGGLQNAQRNRMWILNKQYFVTLTTKKARTEQSLYTSSSHKAAPSVTPRGLTSKQSTLEKKRIKGAVVYLPRFTYHSAESFVLKF